MSNPTPSSEATPAAERTSRRVFLRRAAATVGLLAAGGTVLASLAPGGTDATARDPSDDTDEPEFTPNTEGLALVHPEVFMREREGTGFGDTEEPELDISSERRLELAAPLLTLKHTVAPGETFTALAKRYYVADRKSDLKGRCEEVAMAALAAANPRDNMDELAVGSEVYIPISAPVAVRLNGRTLAEVAEEWGFEASVVEAVNESRGEHTLDDGLEDFIYLPVQTMPQLGEEEEVYVMSPDGPSSYWGIAEERGTGLSTLIGRNRPWPTGLENGHILVVSTKTIEESETDNQLPPLPPPTTMPPSEEDESPQPDPSPSPEEEDDDGVTPEDIMEQRSWTGAIDASGAITPEMQELEQDITIERIEDIVLTREKYEAFINSIDVATFARVFENAQTMHPDGLLESPRYFVIHHTAYGYEPGLAGMERFTEAMKNQGLSVQWAITAEADAYKLVSNPKLACNHAKGVNGVSTGVELMTDESKAQGSVSNEQLEKAMYLAYYVVTEIYGKDPTTENLKEIVVGHREINDRLGVGSAGKPDFFESSMDKFRAKLEDFATTN